MSLIWWFRRNPFQHMETCVKFAKLPQQHHRVLDVGEMYILKSKWKWSIQYEIDCKQSAGV